MQAHTIGVNEINSHEDKASVVIQNNTDFNSCCFQPEDSGLKLEDFEQYRITESTNIKLPVTVIALNGESISTEGSITTFSGASKSGKSACTGFIIAGAISKDGNIVDKLEGLDVAPNIEHKAVIHIDTEQARHKHQYNIKSILKRAGLTTCPDYFLSYNIRQLDINEYAPITTGICEAASAKFGSKYEISF